MFLFFDFMVTDCFRGNAKEDKKYILFFEFMVTDISGNTKEDKKYVQFFDFMFIDFSGYAKEEQMCTYVFWLHGHEEHSRMGKLWGFIYDFGH